MILPPRAFRLAAALFFTASPALAVEITADTTWTGVVTVREDTRVGRGVTLTVEAGTKVYFLPAESTKTEPQFWSPDTELAVEGKLLVKGTTEKPVVFTRESGLWGGIVLAPGAVAEMAHATVSGADEALLIKEARLAASDLGLHDSSTGLVLGPGAELKAERLSITLCPKGVVDLRGGEGGLPQGVTVRASEDAPLLARAWEDPEPTVTARVKVEEQAREFLGEYTVYGEETWSGQVILTGRVTVPPGSMLKIAPGAKVLFRKRDTNGDGLGEGELLVLGSVRCLGTKEAPVLFDSAEENPSPGDWDKVSIISSEDSENRFEHAIFRHGVMALHAHFSDFSATDCRFESNLRALQFQESGKALVARSVFVGNKQAMRFRDSNVTVTDCQLSRNDYALHVFRSEVAMTGCSIEDTLLGGLLAKESRLTLKDNVFSRSRAAMKFKGEGSEVRMSGNKVSENVESALSLAQVKARLNGNDFMGAGLDLVGIDGGDVVLRGNRFGKSGRDAVHMNAAGSADASCNEWSGVEPAKRIHDHDDDRELGIVLLNSKCD